MKKFLIRLSVIPSVVFGVVLFIPYFLFTGKDIAIFIFEFYEKQFKKP